VGVPEIIAAIKAEVPGAAIDFDGPPVPMAPEIAATPYEELLGPMPRTALRQGIALTVSHYRALAETA
jgi:hypothetical protein